MQEFFALIGVILSICVVFTFGLIQGSNAIEQEFQKKMDAGYIRVHDEKAGYIWTKIK